MLLDLLVLAVLFAVLLVLAFVLADFGSEAALVDDLAVAPAFVLLLSAFVSLEFLSDLSGLPGLAAFSSLLLTVLDVLVDIGLSGVSATFTGVLSLSSVSDDTAGVESLVLSLRTSSG